MTNRDHEAGGVFVHGVTFGFRSITLEGMHQFHLNFTEGSNIIKFRSSSKRGVIRKISMNYGPFLLRFWLNCQFVVSNRYHLKGGNIFFKFYRRVKQHKIQVKFKFGGHCQTFD